MQKNIEMRKRIINIFSFFQIINASMCQNHKYYKK